MRKASEACEKRFLDKKRWIKVQKKDGYDGLNGVCEDDEEKSLRVLLQARCLMKCRNEEPIVCEFGGLGWIGHGV